MLESLDTLLLGPLHPLAYRTLAYAQSASYVPLLPAPLLELPRTKPSAFTLIGCWLDTFLSIRLMISKFRCFRRGQ